MDDPDESVDWHAPTFDDLPGVEPLLAEVAVPAPLRDAGFWRLLIPTLGLDGADQVATLRAVVRAWPAYCAWLEVYPSLRPTDAHLPAAFTHWLQTSPSAWSAPDAPAGPDRR